MQPLTSRADLPGNPESFPELVIDEGRDIPSTVAHESPLSIVLDRQQRLLPDGHQEMALPRGFAHEAITFSEYRDWKIGSSVEAILAGVFIEQAAAHLLDELPGRLEANEVASH